MFGKQIADLQLRKKALLLESDLNRLNLRADLHQFREALTLRGILGEVGHQIGRWGTALTPLAGTFFALWPRRPAAGSGFLAKTLAVAPALLRVWRAFRTSSEDSK